MFNNTLEIRDAFHRIRQQEDKAYALKNATGSVLQFVALQDQIDAFNLECIASRKNGIGFPIAYRDDEEEEDDDFEEEDDNEEEDYEEDEEDEFEDDDEDYEEFEDEEFDEEEDDDEDYEDEDEEEY